MEVSLEIYLKDKLNRFEKKYELFNDGEKTRLMIITNPKESFKRVITNITDMKNNIKDLSDKVINANNNNPFDPNVFIIEGFLTTDDEKIIKALKSIDKIFIYGKYSDIKKYIDKNNLKDKKIVINELLKIEENNIYEIIDIFNGYNNVYIMLDGNKELITIEDLKKTINIIDSIINDVKKYNFSPLEEVMYLYDIVRDRCVLEEEKNENKRISRDLTKCLLGDKIVCEGFSNIFNAVLKRMGYKSIMYTVLKKELVNGRRIGHSRNMLHLVDKKYNIDGIYEIDVTWGSKRKEYDKSYLETYKYFLKTRKDMENFKKGEYRDITLPYYTEDIITSVKNVIEKHGIEYIPKDILDTINDISRFIDKETLITPLMLYGKKQYLPKELKSSYDEEYIIDRLLYYDRLFNNPISADILLKALYNVRKQEYYNNPDKYPFNLENLYQTVINSNWVFKSNMSSLLIAIYGSRISEKLIADTKNNLDKFNKEQELDKNIERVKLCKTLRKVLDKRNDK